MVLMTGREEGQPQIPEDRHKPIPPDEWVRWELMDKFEMSGSDAENLVAWCRKARSLEPVVMVGAGFSRNAELVCGGATGSKATAGLWEDFKNAFKRELKQDFEGKEENPLWLAELCERKFESRGPLVDIIRKIVPVDSLTPGKAHKSLAQIRWEAILTTNYDQLIERAFKEEGRRCHVVTSDAELSIRSHRDDTPIIHVHGVIDRPKSIVLTLEDYRKFESDHPGIVTKVRQLFLEHPLLLVGFSATDPNFIEWSGWVRDLVGSFHVQAINVTVDEVGAPRQRYWQKTFSFIHIPKEKIEDLLVLLQKVLGGVSPEELTGILNILLEKSKTAPEAIVQMSELNASYYRAQPPDEAHFAFTRLAERTAHKIVEINYPGSPDKAEEIWKKITGPSASFEELMRTQSDVSATTSRLRSVVPLPSPKEQQQMLRDHFREHWPNWLLEIARCGHSWMSLGHLNIVLSEECESIHNKERSEIIDELRFRVAMNAVFGNLEQNIDSIVRKWVGDRELEDAERAEVEDAKALKKLRSSDSVSAEILDDKNPLDLRRAGFIAALEGDVVNSADLYWRAAEEGKALPEEERYRVCLPS